MITLLTLIVAAASTPDVAVDPVPFAFVRGKILVPVAIGGYGPYTFVLDAAVERPVVDASLGLANPAGYLLLPSLEIGALALAGMPADAADFAALRRTLGVSVTGLLPARIGDGPLAIDFSRNTLSYTPDTERHYDYSTRLVSGENGPEVLLSHGGRMQRARLDLASAAELDLPERVAREWGLLEPGVARLEFEPDAGGAADGLVQVRVDAVRLGGATVEQPLATIRSSLEVPVVGTGTLRHFRILFDFEAQRLYLTHAGSARPQGKSVAGFGLVLHSLEDNLWSVLVAVNSPAYRAGIKSGDLLESIDGETAVNLPYEDLSARLAAEPGRTVKLNVRREGETKEVSVIAEPLI